MRGEVNQDIIEEVDHRSVENDAGGQALQIENFIPVEPWAPVTTSCAEAYTSLLQKRARLDKAALLDGVLIELLL